MFGGFRSIPNWPFSIPTLELERFLKTWDREAENTLKLLRALPASQYDFRPDQGGRSLGELAWHLAEGDAYMSLTGIVTPPLIYRERPANGEHILTRLCQDQTAVCEKRLAGLAALVW
jgi:uncharacterized damage-inducible protein DinB